MAQLAMPLNEGVNGLVSDHKVFERCRSRVSTFVSYSLCHNCFSADTWLRWEGWSRELCSFPESSQYGAITPSQNLRALLR